MNLEAEIYQILRKHKLSLKKREDIIADLLPLFNSKNEQLRIDSVSGIFSLERLKSHLDELIIKKQDKQNMAIIDGNELQERKSYGEYIAIKGIKDGIKSGYFNYR